MTMLLDLKSHHHQTQATATLSLQTKTKLESPIGSSSPATYTAELPARGGDREGRAGFGIGLHHGGLNVRDRSLVEELFSNNKIQGTEYYGEKTKRYVDYVITDILQTMGRAGRPQYDQHGKAVILVHEPELL
ncbi:hypothetical protein TRIUR3_08510 [Triticum urartu]|uniref:Uncharacterized protein n=1 Tax=Triticum urartu TaxID=4572 RepID=M8A4M6_TRIUA|nr:hypothetical protein TRIUR3_08510 [Triticum urartu]